MANGIYNPLLDAAFNYHDFNPQMLVYPHQINDRTYSTHTTNYNHTFQS